MLYSTKMAETSLTDHKARQRLHEIVRKDVPFNEKAREALELGKQHLGVDNGYLTRIDQETNHWEIVVTTDIEDGQASPGLELELQNTYCRETIENDTPLALHDAPNQGWRDDPAFEKSGEHTYLGIPLITEDEPYGTVCFAADHPRSDSFSEAETRFADHLTRLLERELEKELIQGDLTNQTNLATVLHRVLRHNLRNDISVIRGHTELMADQVDDDSVSETVLDHIDGLIDLSQKARELEEVVTSSSERQATEIGPLVEEIAAEISQDYPAASITVEYDNEIQGRVLQNFDRAIEELIENAVKHTGDNPSVTVAVEIVPNGIEIQIKDNGPGLPDHEAEVLTSGVETPLAHGSGLGLWLAYWIVSSHDGSIDPEITEQGTTMTVTIPRKPDVTVQQQVTEVTRSRDKYKTSFGEASEGMVILNDDGRIIEANSAMGTVFGVERGELLGRSITDFLPDESEIDIRWQDALPSGEERGTATVISADGRERVVEYSATADIIPGQHLFVTRDITERRERERELEVAETVFQNTQDALLLVDVVGEQEYRLDRANDAFLAVTPYDIGNITGQTAREILGDEIGGDLHSRFNECVTSQEPVEFELVVPGEEGQRIWQVRLTPNIQGGEVTQLVLVMRNITERKERERRLNAIFNQTFQFTGLLEPDGTVIEANETALEFGGFDREDVVGKPFWEIDWWKDDDRQEIRDAIDRSAAGEFARSEIEAQGSEESAIIDFSARPVTDEQDNVTLLIPEGRDITERKEREQQVESLKERYETLIEAAPDPVFVADVETGELIEVNEAAEALLGMSSDEIIGMHQSELHPSEQTELYQEFFKKHVESGGSKRRLPDGSRTKIVTGNGDRVPVEISATTVSLPDGPVTYGIFRDVSEQVEREQELEETTQRLQLALDGTDTGVWDWTIGTGEVRWSESLERLVGIDPGTFEGTVDAFAEYIHPDDRQRALDAVERAAETESEFETEYRLQREDSTHIWVESRGEVFDDGDDTKRMVGIVTDITERKEREAELTQKTEAMEKAPVGIVLSDPDQSDNPLVYVNERFCELTGYEESEILGRNCRFMQGPETDPESVAEIRDAIDNEEPVTTVLRNYRNDGEMFWNHVTIAPVRNTDGEVSNWVGFQEDATERIEREQQLELAETVFENTQDALFVIDVTENREFRIERVNAVYEEVTGLSNAEIAGRTPTEAVGEEIGSEIESQYRECVERQETIKYPEEIPVDGEQRQWETKVTPVINEGRVDRLVGAMRDVTSV